MKIKDLKKGTLLKLRGENFTHGKYYFLLEDVKSETNDRVLVSCYILNFNKIWKNVMIGNLNNDVKKDWEILWI